MADSANLRRISSSKRTFDKANEEIERTVRKATGIDSEMVKYSEIDKSRHMKESELSKMVSVGELELNDLVSMAATGKASLKVLEGEVGVMKKSIDEIKERISTKRESFMALCDRFRSDMENDELTMLLSEKEELESEKHNLNMKINALQTSTKELLEEILDEINDSCSALEAEIHRKSSDNGELLKEIGELKSLLRVINLSEDSSLKKLTGLLS